MAVVMPRRGRETPENFAKRWITKNKCLDQDGLSIDFINDIKGYGVFARKCFQKNDFLAEYVGDVITEKEAEKREEVYARRNKRRKYPRCYMFFVKHNQMTWCVDATNTSGRVGSMVNDSCTDAHINSKMKKLVIDGNLHLAIFATKDIDINEEILYDYGGDSQNYWWRMPKTTVDLNEDEPNNVLAHANDHVMNCGDNSVDFETTEPNNVLAHADDHVVKCGDNSVDFETTEADNVIAHADDHVMNCEDKSLDFKTTEPDNVLARADDHVMNCGDNSVDFETTDDHVMNCGDNSVDFETTEPNNVLAHADDYVMNFGDNSVDFETTEPDNVLAHADDHVMNCGDNSVDFETTEPDNVLAHADDHVMNCGDNSMDFETTEPNNVLAHADDYVINFGDNSVDFETTEPDNVLAHADDHVMNCGDNSMDFETTEPNNVLAHADDYVMNFGDNSVDFETTEPDNVLAHADDHVMNRGDNSVDFETTEPDNVLAHADDHVMNCGDKSVDFETTESVNDLNMVEDQHNIIGCDDTLGSYEKTTGYKCSVCDMEYRRKTNLCRHIETFHKGTLEEDEYNDDNEMTMQCDDDSDQEYVPDSESPDDDEDYEDDRDSYCSLVVPSLGQSIKHCSKDDEVIQVSQISSSSHSTSAISVSSTNNETGKRIWDKRNACLYCSLLATNIGRHLIRKHSSEAMVAKALVHGKKTKYRQKEFERIRHLGNFYHNAKVLTVKEGSLLVVKRPPKNVEVAAEDYAPCVFCKGYFIAVELWRHYRECKFQDDDIKKFESGHSQKGGLRASRMLKESLSLEDKEDTNNLLFDNMRMDSIGIICKTDHIISELGRNLLASKGNDHINYIRAKMREIARLLLKVREKGEGKDNLAVRDMLKPNMFDLVIDCVQLVCSYSSQKDDQCPKYAIPSLALKIGHTLRKCASLKQSTCIKSSDKDGEGEAESFLKLMDIEYTLKVSAIALNTLNTQRQKNVKPLPVTDDVVKFSSFVKDRLTSLCDDLNRASTDSFPGVYYSLAKVTAAQIITFNKRRSGEVSKMLITDFSKRTDVRKEGSKDVFQMLSQSEQMLSERLDLMHIKGKRGRVVPIILTKDATKALEHLINLKERKKAGVADENNYAFPLSRSSMNNIRGCDALAEVVKDANLNHPETFKSTNLRKYVATVSQVLNMKENELDWLASHLGHDINVHRNFYRLQEEHVELAKISKLLFAVDQGKAHLCAGKTLNDVPIEDIGDVQNFDDDDENDDVDDDLDESVDEGSNTDEQNKCLPDSADSAENLDRVYPKNKEEGDGKGISSQKTGKSCIHRSWTKEEKTFVMQEFLNTIRKGTIVGVGKKQIEEKIRKGGNLLKNRTWVQVKSCIKNIIDKNRKADLKMERRKLLSRK